jgi:hypothetical protein
VNSNQLKKLLSILQKPVMVILSELLKIIEPVVDTNGVITKIHFITLLIAQLQKL